MSMDENSLTITGNYFDGTGETLQVLLDLTGTAIPCAIVSSTNTQIVCNVNLPQVAGTLSATVRSYGGASASTPIFNVLTPESYAQLTGTVTAGGAAGIAVAVVVAAFIVGLILFLVWRRKRAKELEAQMRKVYEVSDEFSSLFNIKSSDIQLLHKLGEGSYGGMAYSSISIQIFVVWRLLTPFFSFYCLYCFLAVFLGTYKKKHVAVKKLSGAAMGQASDFFREASLMMSLKYHPNIVRVYGLCMEANNFSLVMEFVSVRKLLAHLDRDHDNQRICF